MTPLDFALSVTAFIGLMLAIIFYAELKRKTEENKFEERRLHGEYRDLREKYNTILETRNSRETYLKRALEDLAFAEIDRARFALEVVYGKTIL